MGSFWAITGYEYKKLFKRKMVWITFAILMIISISMPFASFLGISTTNGSYYDNQMKDKEASGKVAGRAIDNQLLQEFQVSGDRMPNGLFRFLSSLLENEDAEGTTQEQLYAARDSILQADWEDKRLTQGEKQCLKSQEEKLTTPFIYQYCEGYRTMAAMIYTIGMMQTLFIAVCIGGVFAEEHNQKMDQLILTSRYGRHILFFAKIFAGVTVAIAATVLFILGSAIPNFYIYGTAGFTAQIQIIFPGCSWLLSVGQVLLALVGFSIVKAVLQSIITMALSERFRSSTAAMAVIIGLMIFALFFNIPEQYRILAQIWNGTPSNITSIWGILDNRLVPLFGRYFTQRQVVPFVYLFISAIAVVYGHRVFRGCQMDR